MKKTRKVYSPQFKSKVALEALRGQLTINQLAQKYQLHPNQITQWKKQALEALPDIFTDRRRGAAHNDEALKAQLYQQIGQLKVELD